MDQNTFSQELSAAIEKVSKKINSLEGISSLSALNNGLDLTELETLIDSLSTASVTPYQRILQEHFEPEHKFKTIDDIPEPEAVPTEQCANYIQAKNKQLQDTMFHNLTCCDEHKITTPYTTIENNIPVVDLEKQKKYLEFIEIVRNIPINSITPENCETITKKIVAQYINVI